MNLESTINDSKLWTQLILNTKYAANVTKENYFYQTKFVGSH